MVENAAIIHHIAAWGSSRADIGHIHGRLIELRRCHNVLLMNLARKHSVLELWLRRMVLLC